MLKARRVVTGLDANGRSTVLYDGPSTNALGDTHVQIWSTAEMPIVNTGTDDQALSEMRIDTPTAGSRFWIARYPAGFGVDPADHPSIARAIMAIGGLADISDPQLHTTISLDYLVVLDGEITMVLDDSEVTLKKFDCVVQRGTSHGWENRTSEDCLVAFVLLDAAPLQSAVSHKHRRAE